MTTSEFSNEFDVLYNNITSNQAPGLDEYEKSVFLTKALNEILKAYFSPKTNKSQEGFDGSQKRQYDFSNLIRTANLFNVNTYKERISTLEKTDKRSQVFLFPENYFLSINEIIFDSKQMYSVIPLAYDEYQRLMLKPYALPVKKGAWRLFTDKKNCNYVQEYIDGTECDYTFLSSWADQKRNIKLNISISQWDESWAKDTFTISGDAIYFKTDNYYARILADCGWDSTKKSYTIDLEVGTSQDDDDGTIAEIIKEGFKLLKEYEEKQTGGWETFIDTSESEIAKAATHGDCFYSLTAPSKFSNFSTTGGKLLTTSVILIPIAEIIGKFTGDITYQIRYLRKPEPIILADLTSEGVSIGGKQTVSECELASELHQEILQRAVELAKAAYTGDLTTLVALGQTSETNMGIVAQQSR